MNEDNGSLPVLVVGGGPVGLGLANELGWRGVKCLLVEQGDGTVFHPRANAINVRTMEFCRRWGVVDRVREVGTPPDYPHTALYLTSLAGYEIARIERPAHGGGRSSPVSPERPQRCNQIWFDPVLRNRAAEYPSVTVRMECRFVSFEESENGVVAELQDLKTGKTEYVTARYLVACCGGRSSIRETLGIEMEGESVLGYPIDIFIRAPELWTHHDKGKAALHFLLGPGGIWASFNAVNGNDLWRLTIHGTKTYVDPESLDPEECLARAVGTDFPHEIISVIGWTRRELVATQYRAGNVFLAGDCAHMNSPSGGYGMNTGMGDAVDLGWKLAAALEGWGGDNLLTSYNDERRPVAERNVKEATRNSEVRRFEVPDFIADATPEGEAIRKSLGRQFLEESKRRFGNFGIALGYRYENSPICCPDDGEPPSQDLSLFRQTSYTGCRAPHGWLPDGRSTIDLFGHGFKLLCFGENAPEGGALLEAAAARGVPLEVVRVDDEELGDLYERTLVLVRPDGHVAWRSNEMPVDAYAVIDRVRGA